MLCGEELRDLRVTVRGRLNSHVKKVLEKHIVKYSNGVIQTGVIRGTCLR